MACMTNKMFSNDARQTLSRKETSQSKFCGHPLVERTLSYPLSITLNSGIFFPSTPFDSVGPSTVETFVLGAELLCGLFVSIVSCGVGAADIKLTSNGGAIGTWEFSLNPMFIAAAIAEG